MGVTSANRREFFFVFSFFKSRRPEHAAKISGSGSTKNHQFFGVDFFSRFGWLCLKPSSKFADPPINLTREQQCSAESVPIGLCSLTFRG
jgi:hypothetical protein